MLAMCVGYLYTWIDGSHHDLLEIHTGKRCGDFCQEHLVGLYSLDRMACHDHRYIVEDRLCCVLSPMQIQIGM